MSDERDKALDDVYRELTKLTIALGERGDRRRFGVNCALRVVWAMQRGESVDESIVGILNKGCDGSGRAR
jgi:hypothetical protein